MGWTWEHLADLRHIGGACKSLFLLLDIPKLKTPCSEEVQSKHAQPGLCTALAQGPGSGTQGFLTSAELEAAESESATHLGLQACQLRTSGSMLTQVPHRKVRRGCAPQIVSLPN